MLWEALDNHMMGTLFEELLRKFNEENNVTEAGEHFTPRDYVKLLADLAILPTADQIENNTFSIYDGACGTGGILTISKLEMKRMAKEQTYLNFDQYIRQGEPAQKNKAEAWRVAIGLQAVDGLKTSEYLQQTARRNIEGDITIDEARELLRQYYTSKTARDSGDADKEEADKVSVNITKILSAGTFDFSANGTISLHREMK